MRCSYLNKGLYQASDGKMRTFCYCNNPKSERYKKYTIEKCAVCTNCLDHSKRGAS